jgi:hypothetical protein
VKTSTNTLLRARRANHGHKACPEVARQLPPVAAPGDQRQQLMQEKPRWGATALGASESALIQPFRTRYRARFRSLDERASCPRHGLADPYPIPTYSVGLNRAVLNEGLLTAETRTYASIRRWTSGHWYALRGAHLRGTRGLGGPRRGHRQAVILPHRVQGDAGADPASQTERRAGVLRPGLARPIDV